MHPVFQTRDYFPPIVETTVRSRCRGGAKYKFSQKFSAIFKEFLLYRENTSLPLEAKFQNCE